MEDEDEFDEKEGRAVAAVPTILYYQRTYAGSLANNDQKAVGVFKQYESHEKLRRLQNELVAVKNSKVRESSLERVLGVKRRMQHRSFEHWAELMLLWITTAKS